MFSFSGVLFCVVNFGTGKRKEKNTHVGHILIILTVIRGGFGPEHI